MTLAPHTIHAVKGSRRSSRRLGRGHGSGRGTSAGRGTKGQRARTGGRSRTAIRAFKKALQKIPKNRGFVSIQPKKETVTIATIERIATPGDVITPTSLRRRHAIHGGTGVKVVSGGILTKKIMLQGCLASKSAITAIEKAGGKVVF